MAKVMGCHAYDHIATESVLLVDFLETLSCAGFEAAAMLRVPCDKELRVVTRS